MVDTVYGPYVAKLEDFFKENYKNELEKLAGMYPEQKSLDVDYKKLERFDSEIADEIIDKPYVIIQAMEDAIKQMTLAIKENTEFKPKVRLFNLPKENRKDVRDINSDIINKFICIPGVVTKATEVKPKIVTAVFECRHCNRIYTMPQSDLTGGLIEPLICSCERRNFQLLADQSTFIDTQRAEIQEPLETEKLRGGEQAKSISIWIEGDLTNKLIPGDKIEITGTFRLKPPSKKGSIYDKFIDTNNFVKLEKEFEEIEISDEDRDKIRALARDPEIYEKIISSIAPSIYGLREIKEAIALQLFGGTVRKVAPDGMRIRPDLHVLLIGDPGCIVGDERVALANGAIVKIENMGKQHLEEINTQILTGHGYKRDTATVFHSYKNQPVMEIITESGKSIKGTYNHPLLIVKNRERIWKRLDEIKQGDRVAAVQWIPCTITAPVKTNWYKKKRVLGPKTKSRIPAYLNHSLAGLIGYVLGDGWVREDRVCFLVSEDEIDILDPLVKVVKKEFGISPSIRKLKPKKGRTKVLTEVDINDADVAHCLEFLKEKRVPDLIMQSGNKAVSEFISWLFDADGCAFCKGRGKRAVQLKSASIELLRDVQMLLLRFGIHSRINERNLAIRRSESIISFAKFIGFNSNKKKEKLKQLTDECNKLLETKQNCRHRKTSERVVEVKKVGCADVFDVEVPNTHRFIANGIISHNTAKSRLLQYVKSLAPKGIYVSGKSSTGAGLTATAEKDDFGEGGWTLKAGALVLAAGGMAMIDEFDKMGDEDRSSMHEAMETQEIHVAKAGIVTTFKANTSILAAANPKFGRFDPYATPAEQFNIPPTLLSRFDIIFPIKDKVDEVRDAELANYVLTTHRVAAVRAVKGEMTADLKKKEELVLPVIEPDLLRKYIAYARKTINPVLSPEAMSRIQQFYLELRRLSESQSSIAITARQLEAIVRLAEASAKGRLSESVDIEDADRSIRLLKFYMKEIGVDPETGKFDIDIIATGTSKSKMDKLKTVFRIIKNLSKEYDEVQHDMVLEEAKTQGVKPEDLEGILQQLRKNGDIYSPRYGTYKPAEEK